MAYLVFDVETVADGDLISRVRYSDEQLDAKAAIQKYQEELLGATGKDVIPPTFMLPISVAVAKVDDQFRLLDLTTLDEPDYDPYQITKKFWQGYMHYRCPTFVTFNGRGYDMPVMELAAYRYGLSLPRWFNVDARTYDQSRKPIQSQFASRFNGPDLQLRCVPRDGWLESVGHFDRQTWQDGSGRIDGPRDVR